jgi:hypothetical protein
MMQRKPGNLSQFASFQYLVDQPSYSRERPYHIFDDIPMGVKAGNLVIKQAPEQFVEDVRDSEETFHLDVQGFTFKKVGLSEPIDFSNRDDIEQKYIPSVKALANDVLGDDIRHCEAICWRVSLLSNRPPFAKHMLTVRILAAGWCFPAGFKRRRTKFSSYLPCISSPRGYETFC